MKTALAFLRTTARRTSPHPTRSSFLISPQLLSTCAAAEVSQSSWMDSVKRVGAADAFPNEYPGQNYLFNWSLNADGVTPLNKSAFRITKPLDLKVAGLQLPQTSPLKVDAMNERSNVPEAGSEELSFETFDEVMQRTKDSLSLARSLFCPEGYVPGTRTGVRVISDVGQLATDLVAYLERAPKSDPPKSQPITCYLLGGVEQEFSGYAIEEIEEKMPDGSREAVSVATVLVTGKNPTLKRVVAGVELCVEGLLADAAERAEKKAAEGK